jgi:hypothetical protein
VVNVPWVTEQLVINTLSCRNFEVYYLNLKPSPDIVAARYVDVLKRIREVWLIETKGINEPLVRIDQLETIVNLARLIANPPYLKAYAIVAVVGDGVISFHDGEDLLKKAILLQRYDDVKRTAKGRLVATIDANRVPPFLELPEAKQPCKRTKSTFEYLRDVAVRELEEATDGDIRMIIGDKLELVPLVKAYRPTDDECMPRIDGGDETWV